MDKLFCTKIETLTIWPPFVKKKTEGFTKRPPSTVQFSPNDPLFFFCPHWKTPYFLYLVCHRKTPTFWGVLSAHPRHFQIWVHPPPPTPTCNSDGGNVLYETYVTGQRNLDVIGICILYNHLTYFNLKLLWVDNVCKVKTLIFINDQSNFYSSWLTIKCSINFIFLHQDRSKQGAYLGLTLPVSRTGPFVICISCFTGNTVLSVSYIRLCVWLLGWTEKH